MWGRTAAVPHPKRQLPRPPLLFPPPFFSPRAGTHTPTPHSGHLPASSIRRPSAHICGGEGFQDRLTTPLVGKRSRILKRSLPFPVSRRTSAQRILYWLFYRGKLNTPQLTTNDLLQYLTRSALSRVESRHIRVFRLFTFPAFLSKTRQYT